MDYNEDLCKQIHKRIDERQDLHERRLNSHSDRIDKLEQNQSRTDVKIENVCDQIQSLVTTLRWFIGLMLGAFVSFFFYAAQRGLLK